MELEARRYLEKDRLLHIDMLEPLRLSEAEVLYAGEDGVLIRHIPGNIHMLSAASEESAAKISALVNAAQLLVLHQPYRKEALMRRLALSHAMDCRQAAWMKDEPVPEMKEDADIRPLTLAELPKVLLHYTSIPDEQYARERLEAGMLGIYMDGELAGFIGTHPEGTMGLLEVFPAYRRRGFAYKLEAAMMLRQQSLGRIPYAQIKAGNDASTALHKKLDMEVTPDAPICWLY